MRRIKEIKTKNRDQFSRFFYLTLKHCILEKMYEFSK